MVEEGRLAFLHADRVDDRLARDAFDPRLDHVPLGTVDHHRDARDIGFGRDQLEKGGHRLLGIEQALVHIDVDHLRAVLDLLTGDLDRGLVIVRHDQLLEPCRTGDVGAFADVDESGSGEIVHVRSGPFEVTREHDIVVEGAADIEAAGGDLGEALLGIESDRAMVVVLHAQHQPVMACRAV